ncbi:MBL fold metallo-hydrolase [Corynebacterium tapiri]|uniref:MBL fold metallo-hydrolase n=1 Tax=Corynebacterium tapiri TaxID=1448266 RepID=A0A5C4U567_9CORY|nr:MBL fold metallo-hydrolase [Corynebacterium tapiri]TNL97756.1 MBL fold metallo-hydrolase [Corynebacterium tapiri]
MQLFGFAAGPFRTNCYLVVDEASHAAIVIDPGMHAADTVNETLNQHQLSLVAVVLTHGHIDHTRDAACLAKDHGCPVYIHPDDEPMLHQGIGMSDKTRQLFASDSMDYPHDVRYLHDGERVEWAGIAFDVAHAPGHSPGSVLLIGDKIVFAGDVLFKGAIGRTDLPGSDPMVMEQTLRTVVLPLNDALAVAPGHGPTTSMRAERRTNPFLLALA